MRPLNGKCAMTNDEKNARRRELMSNPAYRALINKTSRKRYANGGREVKKAALERRLAAMTPEERAAYDARRKERDRLRRLRDAERNRERQRECRKRNKDKVRQLRKAKYERDRASGKLAERIRKMSDWRRKRFEEHPELKAHANEVAKAWRKTANGERHEMRIVMARWEEIASGGPDAIKNYMRHASKHGKEFARWYQSRLIDRTRGLGKIVMSDDEIVGQDGGSK